jgi:hypothetical protein
VEQALGVEMQHQYTKESHKSLGVDQPRGQDARRGNTGGPAHKRGKSQHQCHHPYRGKSSESGTSGGSTQRYRAIPKPGPGLVVFVVVMRITVPSVSGVAGALSAAKITRMWCVGGIPMGSSDGSY